MNATTLSPRLNRVAEFVIEYAPQPIRLADIGSDHAYLPCFLAKNFPHHFDQLIAGEVVDGPYQAAKKEVQQNNLEEMIHVRKGNGLAVIQEDELINTITICGMGGQLIQTILEEGITKLNENTHLVLQPNIGEPTLRRWLNQHHFEIVREEVVEDHQRLYSILVARYNAHDQRLTEKEYFLGAYHLQHPTPTFKAKLRREREGLLEVFSHLQKAQYPPIDKITEVQQKLKWIEEIIGKEMSK